MSRVRALVSLFIICSVPMAVGAQAPATTTRSVYVTAVDGQGQAVTGLTSTDLRLRENNRDREIVAVEPASELMRVALMIEETLTPTVGARQGLADLASALQGKAEMSLVVVGLSARMVVPFTTDAGAIVTGLNNLPRSQPERVTHVPEGVAEVARVFRKERAARPVMVLIATDVPQVSNEEPQFVLDVLRDSSAQLHVVLVESMQRASDVTTSAQMLEASGRAQVLGDGPRQSGGRQWAVTALTAVPKALLSIGNDLHNQYKIVYTLPAGTRPSDRLNVTATRRGLTVRAPTRIWAGE